MSPPPMVHVVDDDAPVRVALTRLLRSAGHQVATYETAEALLAAADGGLAGCVLLDLNLPGASGLQLQEQLAARGCQVRIVFLTGHGDVAAGVRAMKQGAVDFLEKPVDDEALLAAVAAALARDAEARRADAELEGLRARADSLTATINNFTSLNVKISTGGEGGGVTVGAQQGAVPEEGVTVSAASGGRFTPDPRYSRAPRSANGTGPTPVFAVLGSSNRS